MPVGNVVPLLTSTSNPETTTSYQLADHARARRTAQLVADIEQMGLVEPETGKAPKDTADQNLARAYLEFATQPAQPTALREAWRDIESAPKDGTLFPAMEDGRLIIACWGETGGMVLNSQGEPDDAPMCWLDVNAGEEAFPDLWMPTLSTQQKAGE
jgi:hypothetical protein